MEVNKLMNAILVSIFTISIASCATVNTDEQFPAWISDIQLNSNRLGPVSKHIINGVTYWHFDNSAVCCDMASPVYDESGKRLCAIGGFAGPAYSNCPEHIKSYFNAYNM